MPPPIPAVPLAEETKAAILRVIPIIIPEHPSHASRTSPAAVPIRGAAMALALDGAVPVQAAMAPAPAGAMGEAMVVLKAAIVGGAMGTPPMDRPRAMGLRPAMDRPQVMAPRLVIPTKATGRSSLPAT